MPSFFKPAKGVQKPHIVAHKPFFYVLKKPQSYLNLNPGLNLNCFASGVFDSNDCIWYYGTLYVKEAVAVVKLNEKHVPESIGLNDAATNHDNNNHDNHNHNHNHDNHNHANHANHDDDNDNDDDAESVSSSISSGNPTAFKHPRSIAKQNQIKYLKDGMRLRHAILANAWDHWHATFHAETNRIIRTPDGVAFDTLRQFARLHCNEVLSDDALYSTNVWSDPQFMYQDDADGQWHPLANLKKK
jgi:hypothetical protein